MRVGRLGIHAPILGFAFDKGVCGCLILCTPLGSFTWFKKNCVCLSCKEYICICKCPLCEKKYSDCDCVRF